MLTMSMQPLSATGKQNPSRNNNQKKRHKAQIPSNEIIIQEIFMLFNLRFIL